MYGFKVVSSLAKLTVEILDKFCVFVELDSPGKTWTVGVVVWPVVVVVVLLVQTEQSKAQM